MIEALEGNKIPLNRTQKRNNKEVITETNELYPIEAISYKQVRSNGFSRPNR
jgi:hypothetical protein